MDEFDSTDTGPNPEGYFDQIGRRKLVASTLVALGGGTVLLAQTNSDEHITQAESRLVELAAVVNSTDTANPERNPVLYQDVTEAIELVNDALSQSAPHDSQSEERISSLKKATTYYTVFKQTLSTAMSLQARIGDSELTVLNHEGSIGYDPENKFSASVLNESIARLTEIEQDPATVTSQGEKLIPDQEQVAGSLYEQRDIYKQHIRAQQSYLDTSEMIEVGIRDIEQERLDSARSALIDASDAVDNGVPADKASYRLFSFGLSLSQYARLLSLRQDGVEKLLRACEPNLDSSQRRTILTEAIDSFFGAREILIS